MIALGNYIIENKINFSLESTIAEVVAFLIEKNLSHIPIVQNDIFLGNISLNDAEALQRDSPLFDHQELLEVFFVRETTNWFEVLEVFSKQESNLIPVLNNENAYVGYYLYADVVHLIDETPFLKETGTTIIIEKNSYNYSMSQIAQIFEINNAKIFGLFISEISNHKVQILIKSTSVSINEIIQTLRRYEYEIISEHLEDQFLSDLKGRSEYLNKYLNI